MAETKPKPDPANKPSVSFPPAPSSVSQTSSRTLYLAYGSDMQIAYMARICPNCRYVGRAVLTDYKWHINGLGFANLTKFKTAHAPGLVFEIDETDKAALEDRRFPLYQNVYVPAELHPAPFCLYRRQASWIANNGGPAAVLEHAFATGRGNGQRMPYTEPHVLMFINQEVTADGQPDARYATAINSAAADAMALGIDVLFFEKVVQRLMPGRSLPCLLTARGEATSTSPEPTARIKAARLPVVVPRMPLRSGDGGARNDESSSSGNVANLARVLGQGKRPLLGDIDGRSDLGPSAVAELEGDAPDGKDQTAQMRKRSLQDLALLPKYASGNGSGSSSNISSNTNRHSKSQSESNLLGRFLTPDITVTRPASAADKTGGNTGGGGRDNTPSEEQSPAQPPMKRKWFNVTEGTTSSVPADERSIQSTAPQQGSDSMWQQEETENPDEDVDRDRSSKSVGWATRPLPPPPSSSPLSRPAPAPQPRQPNTPQLNPIPRPRLRQTQPPSLGGRAGPHRRQLHHHQPARRSTSMSDGPLLSRFDLFLLRAAEHPSYYDRPWISALRGPSLSGPVPLESMFRRERRVSF